MEMIIMRPWWVETLTACQQQLLIIMWKEIKQNQRHPSSFCNFSFSFARRACHRTLQADWGISSWKVKKMIPIWSKVKPINHRHCFVYSHLKRLIAVSFVLDILEHFYNASLDKTVRSPVQPLKRWIRIKTAQAFNISPLVSLVLPDSHSLQADFQGQEVVIKSLIYINIGLVSM